MISSKWFRLLPLIGIIAFLTAPGPQTGGWGFGGNPRGNQGPIYAQFELAPATGAGGFTQACQCPTSVTSANGNVAVQVSRVSAAVCTRGSTTAGIANGDLVTCSSNQVRVMPGFAGTGGNGILIEEARANYTLRAHEIDNPSFSDTAVGAAAPTLNGADATTAPDNTVTAESYTFPATAAAQVSGRSQVSAPLSGVASVFSVFVKGVSAGGTMDICSVGATSSCSPCVYVSTSWSRCSHAASGTSQGILIGNNTRDNGGTVRAANTVYVWGAMAEVGVGLTSFIDTTSAAVTRAAEVTNITVPSMTMSSAAFTIVTPSAYSTATPVPLTWRIDGNNIMDGWINGTFNYQGRFMVAGVPKPVTTAATFSTNSQHRVSFNGNGTTVQGCIDGACSSATPGAWTRPASITSLYVGTFTGGAFALNGVVKSICLDSTYLRCL